jgi:glutaredoxin
MEDKGVMVYVSNNCLESNKLLNLLDDLAVTYDRKNISENRAYLRELQQDNIYATPVAVINRKKILGFRKNKIMKLLGNY